MEERQGLVSFKGKPLILCGDVLKTGDQMPDCSVLDNNLERVNLSSFKGKVCIISSVPSLDTSVCDAMTRKINEDFAKLGHDVEVLTISMDLPFAQNRWCAAADVKNIHVFSDHRDASFGMTFGVMIKSMRLLARTFFIVDREGIVRYIEIVDELTNEPNYEAAMEAAKKLI